MENNQQTIHLARAQRVIGSHPGHLDLHPGPRGAELEAPEEEDMTEAGRWEVRRQVGGHLELA